MDNTPVDDADDLSVPLRLTPDRRYTIAAFVALVVAVVAVVLAGDGPTRLLAAVAVVVLAVYALGDVVFSPRVEADAAGVTVRSPLTRARLSWDAIESVRADVSVRHGLRSTTLEIDAGEVLAVLSRRAIGADPERAAERIRARRPHPLG